MDYANPKSTKDQRRTLLLTLLAILLISSASGINRNLLTIAYKAVSGFSLTGPILNGSSIPLDVWISLALSLAPFGIAKSAADWFSGIGTYRWSGIAMMRVGGVFAIFAALTIGISFLFYQMIGPAISGPLLGLGNGLFGVAEGFFYSSATIRLTNLVKSKSQGVAVGAMEVSVYSGYTV